MTPRGERAMDLYDAFVELIAAPDMTSDVALTALSLVTAATLYLTKQPENVETHCRFVRNEYDRIAAAAVIDEAGQ